MAKISVVVACYNIEKYIEKCLKSIRGQTFKDFECLIIDDGSKDQSAKIIKKVIQKDERFSYFKKENGGVSSARNLGLKKAKGDYICFIDGDDYIEPNYLEILYKKVIEDKSDFAICNIKRVYKNKTTYNKIDEKRVLECRYPALWNKLCKTSLFKKYKIQFLENVWYEDLAVGAQIFLISKKFSVTDAYIYNYIQHENSLVRVYDDRIFDVYKIIEQITSFAKENHVYKKKYDSIEFISIYHILIGTVYRASFHKDFSIDMIKQIYEHVNKEYPNWIKNPYIKNLSFPYRVYLQALKRHRYRIIYLLLKIFGKKIHL